MSLSLARWPRALLALWFGLVMTQAGTARHCSMHDGRAAAAHAMDAVHHAMPHHGEQPGNSSGHDCTCRGACCPGCAPSLLMPAFASWSSVTTATRPQSPQQEAPALGAADHTLPFATAPPSLPA